MKLATLLGDIDERVPHAFSESVIVEWINRAAFEIYKSVGVRDGFRFTAPGGQMIFPLPGDIMSDGISAVTVNGKALTARRIDDVAVQDMWYKVTDGFVGIYPAPAQGAAVTVLYFVKPKPFLTREEAEEDGVDFATQEMRMDADFAELLSLGTLITVCEAKEDTTLANNYKISYNLLLGRARQEKYGKDGKYPVTKTVQK